MVPMGDAKGTTLALMVELLAAGLTGANFAAEASSYLDAKGPPPDTGQLIVAFDPGRLKATRWRGSVCWRNPSRRKRARGCRDAAAEHRGEGEGGGADVPDALMKEIEAI